MRQRKRRVKTEPILFLFIFIILSILVFCIFDIIHSFKGRKVESIKVINSIPTYQYNLDENDSAYVTQLFKNLKDCLEEETVLEEEYASTLAKIFLADFLTLNNAMNKNDIGGVQFVLSTYRDSFIKKAKDTLYRYVENNSDKNREQDLPIVNEVVVQSIEKKAYTSAKLKDENAYYVSCKIEYKEDLDYQTYANLVLVHHDNKLEVAVMK